MSSAQQRQHTQQAVVDVVASVAAPSLAVAYAAAAVSAVLAAAVVAALLVAAYAIAAVSSALAAAVPSPASAWPGVAVSSAGVASNHRQDRPCELFSIGFEAF